MKEKKRRFSVKGCLSGAVSTFLILTCIVCVIAMAQGVMKKRVSIFGCSFYYVLTGSMEPEIPRGAEIVSVRTAPEKLKVGDVITFRAQEQAISGYTNTHRIIDIRYEESENRYYFQTKGDANRSADEYLVPQEDVYGKMVFHTGSLIIFLYLLRVLQTPAGLLLLVVVPVLGVLVFLVRDFIREFNRLAQEEADKRIREEQQSEQPKAQQCGGDLQRKSEEE